MSHLNDLYNDIKSGCWQDPVPELCGCGGSGCFVSDLDTCHWCHLHGYGKIPPPEFQDQNYQESYNNNPFLYEGVNFVKEITEYMKNNTKNEKVTFDARELVNTLAGLFVAVDNFHLNTNTVPDKPYLAEKWAESIQHLEIGKFYVLNTDINETCQDIHFYYNKGTVVKMSWWSDSRPCFMTKSGYVISSCDPEDVVLSEHQRYPDSPDSTSVVPCNVDIPF